MALDIGQFRRASPFAVAGGTEIALQNLPVLLVSAIVTDRVAVAQWGLTRVVAGLVRAMCLQLTLAARRRARPRPRDRRQGGAAPALCARLRPGRAAREPRGVGPARSSGRISLRSGPTAPFPTIPLLTLTLLIGAELVAPAILALGYGYYSDRGELLARTKGLQLVAFLVLALLLTPRMGPLGTALAVVATDLVVQFGLLAVAIMRDTLERPARHVAFLLLLIAVVTAFGWALGVAIRSRCRSTDWRGSSPNARSGSIVVAVVASPLASARLRTKLIAAIPALKPLARLGLPNEILPVGRALHRLGEPQQLLGVDEALDEGDFLGAGDFQALPLLDDVDELRGFEQGLHGCRRRARHSRGRSARREGRRGRDTID